MINCQCLVAASICFSLLFEGLCMPVVSVIHVSCRTYIGDELEYL